MSPFLFFSSLAISPQSHITYLSPALLNIPDIPPTMPPPRNSKISLSPERMTNLSHSDTSDTFSIDHRREQGNNSLHTLSDVIVDECTKIALNSLYYFISVYVIKGSYTVTVTVYCHSFVHVDV